MNNMYQTICNIRIAPIIDIAKSVRKTECMFEIRKFLNELKIGNNEYDTYDAYINVELQDENERKIFLEYIEKIISQYEPQTQH